MDAATVAQLPETCFYIPQFLSQEEEHAILDSINKTPASRWTQLSRRRLLSVPSQLLGAGRDTLLATPLPGYLRDPILPRFEILKIFADAPHGGPNHCLVNEYEPGQGIMPHEDGPAYFPITATVSLGGHTVLDIYEKDLHGQRTVEPQWRLLQEPRSLLVTTGKMYKDTLHGIAEVRIDDDLRRDRIANWDLLGDEAEYELGRRERKLRVSLTYRDVLKVSQVGGALKFLNKR